MSASQVGRAVAVIFATLLVSAQAPLVRAQSPGGSKDVASFGVATELVYVRFHVERKGHYLDSLAKEQIQILEDGRPQAIVLLDTPSMRERSIPPEIMLALDVSSSVMDAGLLDERLLKDVFLASLSQQTTVGVCAFAGSLRCPTPPTRDVEALLSGFEEALQFGGNSRDQGTRLWASVADLCQRRPGDVEKAQRAIVVFSDGVDTHGGEVAEAIQAAVDSNIRIYAVKLSRAIQDTAPRFPGPSHRSRTSPMHDYMQWRGVLDLDRLADTSRGRSYEPRHLGKKQLEEILRSIATEISMEYVAGYKPEGAATGKKRRVKVELVDKSVGTIRDGERTLLR